MHHMNIRPSLPLAGALVLLALATAHAPAPAATTATVQLSMTRFNKGHGTAGDFAGVSPALVHIHVGDKVVFINLDTRHHTATGIVGASSFVDTPHWTDAALHAEGAIGAGAWSTGDIAPGGSSAPVTATKPGTYLWGCFFDYSAGMRGTIVVDP